MIKYSKLFLLLFPIALSAQSNTFDVREYGAVGDGKSLCTKAIQAAADAAATAGGGVVEIPAGTFLAGTIFFPSKVSLHLAEGSILQASPNLDQYISYSDSAEQIGKNEDQAADPGSRNLHFLVFQKSRGASVTGKGTIDGNGHAFWDANWQPLERPSPFILFDGCADITIRDVSITNSPSHTVQLKNCNGVVIDGIRINNPLESPNTDGIDINDTRNVHISNCFMRSGDDLICLKSQRDTVENVVVTNCILESDDAAIKFGTGSRVATRYCSFSNIVIRSSRYGIALFMLDGGVYEHNTFRNITIESGGRAAVHFPIFVDIDKRVADRPYGKIQHTIFDEIQIVSGGKVLISGHPQQPIQDMTITNFHFLLQGEQDFTDANKPRGNKNFPAIETSVDHSRQPANIVLSEIYGGRMADLYFAPTVYTKRQGVWQSNLSMTGMEADSDQQKSKK